MSLPLIKPALPHGKLAARSAGAAAPADYASWTDWDTEDVVDADVIQANWSVIFQHVNGNLNGSDFDTAGSTATETAKLQDWESGNKLWPTWGVRHSHDGVDSAILATGIVGSSLLGNLAFGMIRHPSKDFLGLLLHTMIVAERKQNYTGDSYVPIYYMAIPYDYPRWDPSGIWLYRENATHGTCRFLACPVYANYSEMSDTQKRALTYPALTTYESSGRTVFLEVAMRDTGGVDIPAGWEIHLQVFAELEI